MPIELRIVAFAGVLVVVQLLLAGGSRLLAFGPAWGAGPRDSVPGEPPVWSGRADRACRNVLETFPVFAAVAIAVVVAGVADATTALGAQIYIIARIAYLPVYVLGIAYVRSVIWAAALAGIFMVAWPLLAGSAGVVQ
ncbi:MAPEG family protein [Acuticoccus sp. MNP-M23]|uniref:MAPEG family protein n=1 Tax=Acuticoccus sp. MNP-M23 TaxID=3072793 RepID=UPI002816441F|nr:MAPEG family protein [Acuticoccus sp. MNP-M23]WMS44903.1 MAPEG family protein [Acuticoccus sp. MNP-M23]